MQGEERVRFLAPSQAGREQCKRESEEQHPAAVLGMGRKGKKEKQKNIHKTKLWSLAILRFLALFVLLCLYYI